MVKISNTNLAYEIRPNGVFFFYPEHMDYNFVLNWGEIRALRVELNTMIREVKS